MRLAKCVAMMVAIGLTGCRESHSPSAPSLAPIAHASSPTPAPTLGLQPTIARISPNVVSTAGTWGTITGAQFQPGATLTIGGVAVLLVFRDSTTVQFSHSASHAPGAVDVTLTNPGGLAVTLERGYTYAVAESFDINGEWIAHADARNDYMTDMRFTIRNHSLVSLSCGTSVTMATVLPAHNGSFSFAGVDGLVMSGTLASTTTSFGQVNAPGCGDGVWWADKAAESSP